jgi:hypothetical protein
MRRPGTPEIMASIDWIDAEKIRVAVDLNLTGEEWKAL